MFSIIKDFVRYVRNFIHVICDFTVLSYYMAFSWNKWLVFVYQYDKEFCHVVVLLQYRYLNTFMKHLSQHWPGQA